MVNAYKIEFYLQFLCFEVVLLKVLDSFFECQCIDNALKVKSLPEG